MVRRNGRLGWGGIKLDKESRFHSLVDRGWARDMSFSDSGPLVSGTN